MDSKLPIIPNVIHIKETFSTNQHLQELIEKENLPNGSLVWTDHQTAGRGQSGNSWESEEAMNLTFSLLYKPKELKANQSFIISELIALSIKQVLDQYTKGITIKWPNDIYWKNRKICGILIENQLSGNLIYQSIIGIGINLNQLSFKSNAPNPVSLSQITGQVYDRLDILHQTYSLFCKLEKDWLIKGSNYMHNQYFSSLYRQSGFYTYQDNSGIFEARIQNIEESGHLILERRDGTLSRYAFKEVTYL